MPMDRLVEETLKYGLIPPVVMEFPGITVGGGYAGTSGESSSFRHGFFNCTINYVEMVLANGDVVICSDSEKPDLFHGAAGAVGSIGVTTLVEIQLKMAKKYVKTTYHPISGLSEVIEKVKQIVLDPTLDYVDGILFSKTQGVIITGRLTDNLEKNTQIRRFSAANDPWFYLHVQDTISKKIEPTTEAIPIAEYLFRYDRGAFWVGKSAFDYFKILPFNKFTRWVLDDVLHTRMLYTALHTSGHSKSFIVQDLALPYTTVEKFIEYTDKAFAIFPLWLCPLRQSSLPTLHPHSYQTEADGKTQVPMLSIGLWGNGPSQYDDFVTVNRDIERKLRDLGGMKWLYAHTYYTEEEFWNIYDREWYDALRDRYNAVSLPNVYEKVTVDVEAEKKATASSSLGIWLLSTWPISGCYGVIKAYTSGTFLQARKSAWMSMGEENQLE